MYTIATKRQNGFTLIEVLIASSILSVMMLLLFSSLRVSSRSWVAGEEHINTTSQMTVVQNFFRTYIAGALVMEDDVNFDPLDADDYNDIDTQDSLDEDAYGNEQENQGELPNIDDSGVSDWEFVPFQGNEHELRFVSVMPASAGRGGPQVFTIKLKKEETLHLVVTVVPFLPLLDDAENLKEEVSILDNVEKFAISYWGAKEFSDTQEWTHEWNESYLPKMVRIEIKLENEPAWPAMIIAPRLATSAE